MGKLGGKMNQEDDNLQVEMAQVARIANIVKKAIEICGRKQGAGGSRVHRIRTTAQLELLQGLWRYLTDQGADGIWFEVEKEMHKPK